MTTVHQMLQISPERPVQQQYLIHYVFLAMLFQLSEKLCIGRLIYVQYTLLSNVLIYLLSHSFLYQFGDVAEVGYWSIILESVSVKSSFFKK